MNNIKGAFIYLLRCVCVCRVCVRVCVCEDVVFCHPGRRHVHKYKGSQISKYFHVALMCIETTKCSSPFTQNNTITK
jgi:hypothetical protein